MKPTDVIFELKIQNFNYFEGTGWTHDLSDPFWRLYWHKKPGTWIELGGKPIDCSPDKFTIISPFTPAQTHGETGAHHFYIHFLHVG